MIKRKCSHFKIYEIVDPKTFSKFGESAWRFFQPAYLIMLDDFWEYVQGYCQTRTPVYINTYKWGGQYQWSGLRTPDCKIGASYSMHRLAEAADFKVGGFSTLDYRNLRHLIIEDQDNPLLKNINRMESKTKTWIHLDRANVDDRIHVFEP